MELTNTKFTVYFENPFWVGVYERQCNSTYEVCKVRFDSEPKEYEIYEFLLKNWCYLKFSSSIVSVEVQSKKINPKRMQREIKKKFAKCWNWNKSSTSFKTSARRK